SLATVSAARWYQRYNNPDKTKLNIDPYICGTVLTYSSNAPIGDSAPTTSCFMTGFPSRAGWVSTYPIADPGNDIIPMNPDMAYQPLMTVLEAARITQNKATGLVCVCEFPHATPADCASHSYNRGKYDWIAPQMAHNNLDIMIGGGAKIINEECINYLKNEGYGLFLNDINGFRNYSGNKMWSLFAEKDMSYDLDRNPAEEPSLAEMTAKAIEKLSKNKNGFFLMVEGSKIDWAAHANDPIAMITDMLAFDEACGVALDFAKKDGETVIVIVPDHGNSGFSIGSRKCSNYSTMTKDDLFKNISQYKCTAEGLIKKLRQTEEKNIKQLFLENTGIDLSNDELNNILKCDDYSKSSLSDEERMKGSKLNKVVANILDSRTCFGFTTGGHTGEEVFLAIYDPTNKRPTGHITNIDVNRYLFHSLGLKQSLSSLTNEYFAKHTDIFKGYQYNINQTDKKNPVLEVTNKNNKLEIRPNTNIVLLNGKELKLKSVVIFVDKNETFYLPESLRNML
ncbi:MAG: alkaline phosphatase, partial [Dysgonamonadaceae bacterium]|nr:alkaline phosphatase [Dysgonamonadaceae bacterium]